MRRKHQGALYNVLFPLWLFVWFPSILWLLLIPANYALDFLVFWLSLPKDSYDSKTRRLICEQHTWKICLAGFLADLIGSLLVFGIFVGLGSLDAEVGQQWAYAVVSALNLNPWTNILALAICLACMAISATCIFLLNRAIFRRAGLGEAQAKRSALWLAIATAPYLFLFPSVLLYS